LSRTRAVAHALPPSTSRARHVLRSVVRGGIGRLSRTLPGRGDGRWLLLGASGLVGTHLQGALRERNVVMTSNRSQVPGAVTLDLTDGAATARLIGETRPDIVVVAAANAFVEECEREPEATRAINVDAVRRVAEAAPDA